MAREHVNDQLIQVINDLDKTVGMRGFGWSLERVGNSFLFSITRNDGDEDYRYSVMSSNARNAAIGAYAMWAQHKYGKVRRQMMGPRNEQP